MTFTARISIQFAVLVTATMAFVLAVGGWLLSLEAVNGLDLLNHAEFVEIRDRLGSAPEGLSDQEIDRRVRSHTEVDAALYFFQIHNESGHIIFRSANLGKAVLPDLSGRRLQQTVPLTEVGDVRICEFYHGPLHVQIASPLAPAYRLLRGYARVSLILLGTAAVASVGLGWGFARFTLRPVRAIHDTAARIRGDNLGERIPIPAGRDELAALARLLNRMFDGLESSFAQVKRFTSDASHELKTPLALIRLHAEKLRPKLAGDPDGNATLGAILEEIERLRRITESLLFLAKAESGTFVVTTTAIPTKGFISDFAEDAEVIAEDRNARFVVSRSDSGVAVCEPTLIRQLLLNLTSNALNASPSGARVELESAVTAEMWQLTVSDEGAGLPADQLERVFERFVRYPSSLTRPEENAGHGLGLAICRSIVTLHGGTIRIGNRSDRSGLRVAVELPLRTADQIHNRRT